MSSACIDIIAVRQPDGSMKTSPFFVRFSNASPRTQVVKIRTVSQPKSQDIKPEKEENSNYPSAPAVSRVDHPQNTMESFINRYMSNPMSSASPVSTNLPLSKQDIESDHRCDSPQQVSSPLSPESISETVQSEQCFILEKSHYFPSFFTTKGLMNQESVLFTSRRASRKLSMLKQPQQFQNEGTDCSTPTPDSPNVESSSSTPSSPMTPTRSKLSFSDRWIRSIESEAPSYEQLSPTSQFVELLHLSEDVTHIEFEANGETIQGRIFLWNHNDQIIISDVDGTITKSDVMGQLKTRLGLDHTHSGIARLYSRFQRLGYRIMYLTARPITQFKFTRDYIDNIDQHRERMPLGPIICTPNTPWNSIAREVIIRRPETFKIPILSAIKVLFSDNPFVAGWGNRVTDCFSYRSVGVNPSLSFQVNPRGEIQVHSTNSHFKSHSAFESVFETMGLFPIVHDISLTKSPVSNPDFHS